MTSCRSDGSPKSTGGGTLRRGRPPKVKERPSNHGKNWTTDDDEQLRELWGCYGGIPRIARALGRNEGAIKLRATRLKLGPYRNGGELVSLLQVARSIVGSGKSGSVTYSMRRWEERGLPVHKTRVQRCAWKQVDIEEFWSWAEKNQDILDFSRFEENALGMEPDWAKWKRKIDQRNRTMMTPKKCPWSPQEDALLTVLCESGDKTHEDLQRVFQRTSSSIRRRIYDLALPRPLKSPTKKWTSNDLRQIVHMTESGYGHDWIAKTMNRSAQAVRGKLEWIEKKGLWEEYGGRPLQASGHRPDEQRARQAP